MGDPDNAVPPLVTIPLAWSEEGFIQFMRTGTRPNGMAANGDAMPWQDLSRLLSEDDELRAVYAHRRDVGPKIAE